MNEREMPRMRRAGPLGLQRRYPCNVVKTLLIPSSLGYAATRQSQKPE